MIVYGVKMGGEILPETIGPHPRSAIVNWVWFYVGKPVTNDISEETIKQKWFQSQEKLRQSNEPVPEVVALEVVEKQVVDLHTFPMSWGEEEEQTTVN